MGDWFPVAMQSLLVGQKPANLADCFDAITRPDIDELKAAAFLSALRVHDLDMQATPEAVEALRKKMTRLDPRGRAVVDTCGTGGDHSGTFNISTAAAFVVAGAGQPVVKHGNRAVSSTTGSADVLAELGVPIENGPAWAQACLDEIGFAFCFAPHFHPSMKHVAAVRKRLGFRTIFNLVGPLLNPAGARHQLIGVGSKHLVPGMTAALARLDVERAVVVHGLDGLDEVTLNHGTWVNVIESGVVTEREWPVDHLGLPRVPTGDLKVDNAKESAMLIERILKGEDLPAAHVVVANAATALWAARKVPSPGDGVPLAKDSIASGRAYGILHQLRGA